MYQKFFKNSFTKRWNAFLAFLLKFEITKFYVTFGDLFKLINV